MKRTVDADEKNVVFTFIRQFEPARLKSYLLYLPARIRVGRAIRRFNPDLVHGFGTETCFGVIASDFGARGIVMIQGIHEKLAALYDGMGRLDCFLRGRLEEHILRRVGGAITENQFGANWLAQKKFRGRVAIIPHGVNPEFFHLTPEFSEPEILCVGTLSRIKGQDTALRAIAAMRNRHARLVLVGLGLLQARLEQLADELGIRDRVEFCGFLSRAELIERMKKARALAMLSRMDTSPNVITEAHAAGLPVVATRAGGIPEMVEDGQDGFLVPIDDAQAAAQRFDVLLENVALARQMGERGRKKVRVLNDPMRVAWLHREFYLSYRTHREM